MQILKVGSEGGMVKLLQQKLIQLGFLRGNADGSFGELTAQAVVAFQKKKKLKADGCVGAATWKAMGLPSEEVGADLERRGNDAPELWYPGRVKEKSVASLAMMTKGQYRNAYPEGAVVHFTAGRARDRAEEGPLCQPTHFDQGVKQVKDAVAQNAYCFFVIARDGSVFQNFPLDQWGYHAGESSWPDLGNFVSNKLVGIEVMSAGLLQDFWGPLDAQGKYIKKNPCPPGKLAAWYTRPDKGDKYFEAESSEVRSSPGKNNIQRGQYHAYSKAQEEALVSLLLWLESNGQGIFSLEHVLGHDEVAPHRKNDPGAALSMSMPEFRAQLRVLKAKSATGRAA